MSSQSSSSGGVGTIGVVGVVAAMVCSFMLKNGIGWVLFHGVLGWLYLAYLCAGFGGGLPSVHGAM